MQTSKKKKYPQSRKWFNLRSILGNDWALFFFLIGGREIGKSYATTKFFVKQFIKYGRPFYWLRLSDSSAKKLLQNNAEKLIDPDIRRKYNLELETSGTNVYRITYEDKDSRGRPLKKPKKVKTLMARVLNLATFYNDKGSGLFDAEFLNDPNMYYNICLDEMNREKNEKKTFDIVYAFANQLENLVRSTKKRMRIICIGNTLEEASDILEPFGFMPMKAGRYYLRDKRAVIEKIEQNETYRGRRSGTVAQILAGSSSTFTDELNIDTSLITKKRLQKPRLIIKFGKEKTQWFVLWDDNVIAKYNNEVVKDEIVMLRYIDGKYIKDRADMVLVQYDLRNFQFKNIATMVLFKKLLQFVKPK